MLQQSLTYGLDCIVEALSNPEKEQMKHDGFTIGLWMQSNIIKQF